MSEADLSKQVREDVSDKPLGGAITRIADHVQEQETRHENQIAEVKSALTAQDDKMEEGFRVMKETTERILKRTSHITGSGPGRLNTRDMLEATPEKIRRKHMWACEIIADYNRKGLGLSGPLATPEGCSAMAAWLVRSTMAQLRGFDASQVMPDLMKLAEVLGGIPDVEEKQVNAANLIPTDTAAEIWVVIRDASVAFGRFRQWPMSTEVVELPTSDKISTNWIGKGTPITETHPTFSQAILTAKKLANLGTVNVEDVDDSAPDLLSFLLQEFTEAQAVELDVQSVETGTELTDALLTAANPALDIAGGGTANFDFANALRLYTAAGQASIWTRGFWFLDKVTYADSLRMEDSNGNLVVKFGQMESAPAGTLFGRPIIPSGNWSDSTIAIFAPSTAYVSGIRQGMRWDVSEHSKFAEYQVQARLVGRFAGVTAKPGEVARLTNFAALP